MERTKLSIRQEEQKLKKIEAETEKKISEIDAETVSIIENLKNKERLATQNINKKIESLENEILSFKATAMAQAKRCNIYWMKIVRRS